MKALLFFLCSTPLLFGGTYSLTIATTTEAVFIELPLPAGATVKDASDGGSFDASKRSLKWGPLLPAPSSVSFTLENEPNGFNFTPIVEPATLGVTASDPTQIDSDRDGLPDDYESQFQLDQQVNDSGIDHDKDGLSTLAEFFLGTNPLDAQQRLETITLERGPETLTWIVSPPLPSFAFVESAVSLDSKDWLVLPFSIQNDGTTSTLTVQLTRQNRHRFFRLRFNP